MWRRADQARPALDHQIISVNDVAKTLPARQNFDVDSSSVSFAGEARGLAESGVASNEGRRDAFERRSNFDAHKVHGRDQVVA